ncbi:MAG: aminotransferase class V-fold PLP-dependent enzyme [Flavobacteriales bacterium]|nr:aminotransferase class V-fold PLP-dependent enzyme [Flavobacteriales bacterium]
MDKREFLKTSLLAGFTVPAFLEGMARAFEPVDRLNGSELAQAEDFWASIRTQFLLKTEYINLENGYYCMLPIPLLEKYLDHVRNVNLQGSWYMRNTQHIDKVRITELLAAFIEAEPGEVAITRNTTESLDLVIQGIDWKKGDEALVAEQDYGSMLDMFRLMEEKHGIVVKRISIPNHPQSDDEILELYKNQFSARTRLVMVCHMINITGQILPVRKICDLAHAHKAEVMVDGAHSVAHIPVSMKELGCDYFGSSLHKWLQAPLGNGLLYVRKDKISGLSPLFAESPKAKDDIARLNHTGTTPVHTILGIEDALNYHRMLGADRKTDRLRFLQNYWTAKVRSEAGIEVNTPEDPARSCGIANVNIPKLDPAALSSKLLKDHGIWTVAIDRPGVKGCRITPNIYTSLEELDRFVDALTTIARS